MPVSSKESIPPKKHSSPNYFQEPQFSPFPKSWIRTSVFVLYFSVLFSFSDLVPCERLWFALSAEEFLRADSESTHRKLIYRNRCFSLRGRFSEKTCLSLTKNMFWNLVAQKEMPLTNCFVYPALFTLEAKALKSDVVWIPLETEIRLWDSTIVSRPIHTKSPLVKFLVKIIFRMFGLA